MKNLKEISNKLQKSPLEKENSQAIINIKIFDIRHLTLFAKIKK